MRVAIIDYGAGNLFSVRVAVERLGAEVVETSDAEIIMASDRVIFPGVGHARAAMERLVRSGLDRVIPHLEMPVLGICLGMQLMCRHTAEGDTVGLGIFPVDVEAIPAGQRVPHTGWNDITGLQGPLFEGVAEGAKVYFVHSYRVPTCEHTIATCDYGGRFSAALRYDNFYGCQFHPEKSAGAGQKILRNFLEL